MGSTEAAGNYLSFRADEYIVRNAMDAIYLPGFCLPTF